MILFPLCLGIGLPHPTMAKHLWHDLQGAFDSAVDDTSYEFSEAAAAMLLAVQQWLYDEGFTDAADALDDEITLAETQG